MLKVILFDAMGTLIRLTRTVGECYHEAGERLGCELPAPEKLDAAFRSVWKHSAPPSEPAEDDDRGWWQQLVNEVLDEAAQGAVAPDLDRLAYFETAYHLFTEPGVWEPFPEVHEVLDQLQGQYRLAILSNFDGRLRIILQQLHLLDRFDDLFISSEMGFYKPDPRAFAEALRRTGCLPGEALHVGDDPARDWAAAEAAGLRHFQLARPSRTMRDLLVELPLITSREEVIR